MSRRPPGPSRRAWLLALFAIALPSSPGSGGTTIFGPAGFKSPGGTVQAQRTFSVADGSGDFALRMAHRNVTFAVVTLNDQVVWNGQPPKLLERQVPLLSGANGLLVELTGPEGAVLEIEIVRQTQSGDTTPPVITASADPPPVQNGWNRSAVTVTFTCTDEGSGIASCPPPATVSSDGANQVVSGTAVDQAGNTATASVTLNIDQSPPVITLAPPASVFTATATLAGAATDAASGVESVTCNGSPATLSGDSFACSVALVPGPNTIDARVVDFAGNSAAAPAVTIERQESPVEGLAAAPPAIPHQVPTVVTFTLRLAAPALALVHAVDLERRDESGGFVATYGPMRDDGMSGDEGAGDGTYTLQVSLLETGPQVLRLHASIDFEGQESRSLSDPFLLPVAISESVNDVRASLVAALSAGQLDTAYSRLGRQFNDERILDGLSPDVLQAVATALQGCTPGDTSGLHAICAGPVTLPDRSRQLHFLFVVDMVGHWRLISW